MKDNTKVICGGDGRSVVMPLPTPQENAVPQATEQVRILHARLGDCMRRGPQINPSKVYLDPAGCKRGHDPCVRRLSDGKCVDCGRLAGVAPEPADRYCQKCGCPIEEDKTWKSKFGYCSECSKLDPRWYRGRVYLCAEGDKAFLGGHFRPEDMDVSLVMGSWDIGMVFEEWEEGEYKRSVRVIPAEDGVRKIKVVFSARTARTAQTLEIVDRQPKGDGRYLKP